jgi:hypothetical protein
MSNEFIPYTEALALKELGFDQPCMASKDMNNDEGLIQLPLYQQAFRFFREKYKYSSYIKEATKDNYRFYIEKFDEKFYNSEILSYEEAELACLEKLIEIVEQKEKI